jgi:hypothetical protein
MTSSEKNMIRRLIGMALLFAAGSAAWADIPGPGPRPNRYRPLPDEVAPPAAPAATRLLVSCDMNATSARLILPAKLSAAMTTPDSPRAALALSGTAVGLAFAGSLIAGGVWLARFPRSKFLVAASLCGVVLIGLTVQAQPGRIGAPRTTIDTGKVRVSRGAGADFKLILPKLQPAPK